MSVASLVNLSFKISDILVMTYGQVEDGHGQVLPASFPLGSKALGR